MYRHPADQLQTQMPLYCKAENRFMQQALMQNYFGKGNTFFAGACFGRTSSGQKTLFWLPRDQ